MKDFFVLKAILNAVSFVDSLHLVEEDSILLLCVH